MLGQLAVRFTQNFGPCILLTVVSEISETSLLRSFYLYTRTMSDSDSDRNVGSESEHNNDSTDSDEVEGSCSGSSFTGSSSSSDTSPLRPVGPSTKNRKLLIGKGKIIECKRKGKRTECKRKGFKKISQSEWDIFATFIVSPEQIKKITSHVKEELTKDVGMNVTEGRLICVKKLTDNNEAVNQEIASPEPVNYLKMLITGFCQIFSSIANDTFSSTVNKGEDIKVTLIQKWNAILSKFKPGRMAALGQERAIMDNILSLSPDVTEADTFAVICAIHVIVYKKIHRPNLYKKERNL